MRLSYRVALAAAVIAALLAACAAEPQGSTPGTSEAPRTIEMTMNDQLRFVPDRTTVAVGETIRFVVTNSGVLEHEFVIGDEHEQEEHAAEMMDGGMMHDEANAMSVPAGETRELVFTFHEPGELLIGCHVDGHYDAGMVARIIVE
jgi:uncharacterized cupredoxin-like copper-binding protein